MMLRWKQFNSKKKKARVLINKKYFQNFNFIVSPLYCYLHVVSIFNTFEAGSDKLHRFSKFHDSAISA